MNMGAVKPISRRDIVAYEQDILLWSQQQAQLLREGRFSELDIEHLADEIEDVGKTEKRELSNRCGVLIAHLLKWIVQADKRTNSWRATIRDQRERIDLLVKEAPSLKSVMRDPDWRRGAWLDAREQARRETKLRETQIPKEPPFTLEQAIDPDFWPD
jgi:hypothetical protein